MRSPRFRDNQIRFTLRDGRLDGPSLAYRAWAELECFDSDVDDILAMVREAENEFEPKTPVPYIPGKSLFVAPELGLIYEGWA